MKAESVWTDSRKQKSPCCDAKIQVVYRSQTSERLAVCFICLKCDRLHVVDSRDDEK